MQIVSCEQGSDEWFRARMGIPTASEFSTVMAQGKAKGYPSVTRRDYMLKLAAEIITGEPMEPGYTNEHFERGKEWEPDARSKYAFIHDIEPEVVGFIRRGAAGCSPDSLVGNDGGLEIKTCLRHIQIDRLLRNEIPASHVKQVQGCLWIAEREWWDFVSYNPSLPMLTVRVYRDEDMIRQISEAVDKFNTELAEMVERVRAYK